MNAALGCAAALRRARGVWYNNDMAINITYWPAKEGGFLGYMNDYPDYPTQGETLEELKFMLGDILDAIRDGDLEDTAANRMCDSFVHA